jgi:hypothetical protein
VNELGTLSVFGQSWKILGGQWEPAPDGVVGSGGWLMTREEFGDTTIEIDIEHVSGMGGRTTGVGFRYQPWTVPEQASGYGVNITTGGTTYNVFKGVQGAWNPVNPAFTTFQPSPALQPRKNHFEIRSVGAAQAIKVNGQPLAEFNDSAYAKGAINLWVESTVDRVKFSNFRVTR